MQTQSIFKTVLAVAVMLVMYSFTANKFQTPNEISLKVKVSSVKTAEGNIHVLLFNQAVGYPTNPAKAFKHIKGKATAGEVNITIDKLPAGTYSIVAFHDKNANEEFDKSWFGSPKEDYGFSNIPSEFCGTPSFQQTSFVVNPASNSVTVKLMNLN